MDPGKTQSLLRRWHDGDSASLHELLDRDMPWIQERIRRRLGSLLRARRDVDDYVQEAVIKALQYTPRFVLSDRTQFRALLARMTENVIRDEADRQHAARRDVARERPVPGDSLLDLDPPVDSVTRPNSAADRDEARAWARLAVELLPAEERAIVRMRQWEELSFAEIGEKLGMTRDAAKMRFQRLLPRLARTVTMLRAGRVGDVLGEHRPGAEDDA
ncbi:MAG: sigma-70 family RNA polymerase sigma factor [Planctomycetes bacterium]|nr:sigma-70 family RNA polymerase sigma factor [Planctomycetota bacterium]MCB9888597.1 sigma-70 family RNA polymerase sigma factor [Planctomycetota bacterium]